jgi:integrase
VRQTLAKLESLNDTKLTDLDDTTISSVVSGMTSSMRNSTLAVLSAIFSWAAETDRKWVRENPVKLVKREDEGGREVQIFTNSHVMRVLVACRRHDPEFLAYHLFGFFAGIRPDELPRMRWEMVDVLEKHIVLPASVTKSNARRVIEMEDCLVEWLSALPSPSPNRTGPISPQKNIRKRLRSVRDVARVDWIQDGMRHTYASNWLAMFGDEHKLRSNMGHRSADELWDHYHRAVPKRDAQKFWSIRPRQRQTD